jgi:hypothetical protein
VSFSTPALIVLAVGLAAAALLAWGETWSQQREPAPRPFDGTPDDFSPTMERNG